MALDVELYKRPRFHRKVWTMHCRKDCTEFAMLCGYPTMAVEMRRITLKSGIIVFTAESGGYYDVFVGNQWDSVGRVSWEYNQRVAASKLLYELNEITMQYTAIIPQNQMLTMINVIFDYASDFLKEQSNLLTLSFRAEAQGSV